MTDRKCDPHSPSEVPLLRRLLLRPRAAPPPQQVLEVLARIALPHFGHLLRRPLAVPDTIKDQPATVTPPQPASTRRPARADLRQQDRLCGAQAALRPASVHPAARRRATTRGRSRSA